MQRPSHRLSNLGQIDRRLSEVLWMPGIYLSERQIIPFLGSPLVQLDVEINYISSVSVNGLMISHGQT